MLWDEATWPSVFWQHRPHTDAKQMEVFHCHAGWHEFASSSWNLPEEGVGGQDGTDAARRHQVQDTSEGQSSACDHPEDQELMGHGMGR